MKTLIFKKSLDDEEVIEIKVLRWMSTKNGIYAQLPSFEWDYVGNSMILFNVK